VRAPFDFASFGERSDSKRSLDSARTGDGLITGLTSSPETALLDFAGDAPDVKGNSLFADSSNAAGASLVSDRHLVGNNWFHPSWTEENESGCPDHGEFQSPVWLAVGLALKIRTNTTPEGGTDSTDSSANRADVDVDHGGELRRHLACVAESLETAERRRELHELLRPLVRHRPSLTLRHSSGNDTFHHWRTWRFLGHHETRFHANHVAPRVKSAEDPSAYFRGPRVAGTQ
jgi:hypothetical protein